MLLEEATDPTLNTTNLTPEPIQTIQAALPDTLELQQTTTTEDGASTTEEPPPVVTQEVPPEPTVGGSILPLTCSAVAW